MCFSTLLFHSNKKSLCFLCAEACHLMDSDVDIHQLKQWQIGALSPISITLYWEIKCNDTVDSEAINVISTKCCLYQGSSQMCALLGIVLNWLTWYTIWLRETFSNQSRRWQALTRHWPDCTELPVMTVKQPYRWAEVAHQTYSLKIQARMFSCVKQLLTAHNMQSWVWEVFHKVTVMLNHEWY